MRLVSLYILIIFSFSCGNYTKTPYEEQLLRGKALFSSNSLSGDGKSNCMSCHTNNNTDRKNHDVGLTNGVTLTIREWDTQTLWNVKHTAPYLWDGSSKALVKGLNLDTLQHTQLKEAHRHVVNAVMMKNPPISENDLEDLTVYVESLKSPVSPFLNTDLTLTALQEKGKKLFNDPTRGNCISCHSGDFFTDGIARPVKKTISPGVIGIVAKIETPSLNGMWDTAPYWHDGSMQTIRELLDRHTWIAGPNVTLATPLSEEEKIALEAYLNAL